MIQPEILAQIIGGSCVIFAGFVSAFAWSSRNRTKTYNQDQLERYKSLDRKIEKVGYDCDMNINGLENKLMTEQARFRTEVNTELRSVDKKHLELLGSFHSYQLSQCEKQGS